MAAGTGLTAGVAGFARNCSLDSIPSDVIAISRRMMLNGIAVAVGALDQPEARTITEFAISLGGYGECSVIGSADSTSAPAAALANGTLVHLLDFDEAVLRRANHPTNVMLPAALAVGEARHRSGRDVLEAFIVGCEVSTKLGAIGDLDSVNTRLDYNGWHVEGVAGAIGAAVCAGRLFELDAMEMRHAIGIAASTASGLQANFGTSAKSLHCGLAAMHGIMAATLASSGFTANTDALEVKGGFLDCYRRDRDVDAEDFIMRLGRPYDVVEPGVALKFYPCGSALHTAIDLTVALVHDNGIAADDIDRIHVSWPGLPRNKLAGFGAPETGLAAKFSLPYVVAVAALYGTPSLRHFTDEATKDQAVVRLMRRVGSSADEPATREASRPATVTVTLINGRVLQAHADHAVGHPSNPMSDEQLEEKFFQCADRRMSTQQIEGIISSLRSIDGTDDVACVMAGLRA